MTEARTTVDPPRDTRRDSVASDVAMTTGLEKKALLTAAEVRGKLGKSQRQIQRYISAGRLTPRDIDGEPWFDPIQVDELLTGEGPSTGEMGAAELLTSANGIIRQQQAHNEVMMRLFGDGMMRLLTLHAENAGRDRARINELEERLQASHSEVENARNVAHTRELETRAFEAKQKRLDSALQTLQGVSPLLMQLVAKKMLPDNQAPQESALIQFVATFTADEALAIASALGGEKGAVVLGLWQSIQDGKKPTEVAPTTTTEEATA